jgi:glycosyltransferase involved in cell wall biosynthesis
MPLNVLFLIDSLRMGGAERITAVLLPHLDRHRITPIICTLHDRRQSSLVEQLGDVELINLDARRLIDPLAIRRLLQVVRDKKIDIIHAQLQDATIFAGLANQFTGVPVVVTRHLIGDDAGNFRRRMRNWVEQQAIRRWVVRVISVSDAARDAYAEMTGLPLDRFQTIYNGIEIDNFIVDVDRDTLRDSLNLPTDKPLVVMVGVMRPGKGHEICIAAARQFADAHFLLIGDGKPQYRAQLESQVDGIGDRVHFLGQRMDIHLLLAASNLLVLPSDSEALPTVLIEAAAAGLPVVASDVGGVSEIVDDGVTGLLIPPRDPSALAEAIRLLLSDPAQMAQMGGRAREIVASKFTLSRQANDLIELYENIVIP